MPSTAENEQHSQWYAMRATYHREMSVKSRLEADGFETYLPTTCQVKTLHGRKRRVVKPAVSNLLFVKSEKQALQRFKAGVPELQYITRPMDGRNVPIIVPERQMSDFIAVTSDKTADVSFLLPEDANISRGTRVRIHGGAFDSMEGVFTRISGKRNKRVVIEISGVVAVALDVQSADYIEVLP